MCLGPRPSAGGVLLALLAFLSALALWARPGLGPRLLLGAASLAALLLWLTRRARPLEAPEAASLRREKEEALGRLSRSEAHLGTLVEAVEDYAIFQSDPQGRVASWNPGAERLLGWRAEEILGQDAAVIYAEEEILAGQPSQDQERARQAGILRGEAWRVRKDGSRFMAMVAITPLQDPQGQVAGFIRVTHDLTARLEAEARLKAMARDLAAQMGVRTAQLQESEARILGFIRHAPAAIAVKGLDGKLLLVNRRAEALIGRCLAATPLESAGRIFPPESVARGREEDQRVLATREELQGEEVVGLPDGSTRTYLVQKFPLIDRLGHCWGVGVIATNLTQEKQHEQARLQHQKLESLSLLAGGLAHEFNNILGAMLGNVELARLDLGPLEQLGPLDDLIGRASGLVAQVLAYAGMGRTQSHALDLNLQVEEMTRILRATLPQHVVLAWQPGPGLPPMEGDAVQIKQVILNLVLNAAEAVDPVKGVITLRTGWALFSQTALEAQFGGQALAPGPYLTLEVADNGPGMGPEVKERAFEPFFSTKFAGRGLGLAAVQGILRGHRGGIRLVSEKGAGTTFTFLFPAAPGARVPEPAPAFPSLPCEATTGLVLVVDDEDAVRTMAVRALRRLGLDTLEARDGVEALAAFAANRDRIHLILLDLTMPRMGGEEAYRELRQAGALAPVILCSGFGPEEALLRFRGMALAGFLQKPYRLRALLETIGDALDGMDGAASPRGNPPRERVAWQPEFATGHPLLDAQHQSLLRAYNHLVASTGGKRGNPPRALALLIEALAAHAAFEEGLMAASAFPGIQEHQAAHAGLVNHCRNLAQRIKAGEAIFSPAVFNVLEDDLLNHIQLNDQELARHLAKGQGS